MEQDGIQIIVKRRKIVLDEGWIDAWSELDLVPYVPAVYQVPVSGT